MAATDVIEPLINTLNVPFWEAAGRGELCLPWCAATSQFFWPPAPVSPNAEVAGLKAKFIDVQGVRTRYYEYGQGEPLVLVHGGGRGTTSSSCPTSP